MKEKKIGKKRGGDEGDGEEQGEKKTKSQEKEEWKRRVKNRIITKKKKRRTTRRKKIRRRRKGTSRFQSHHFHRFTRGGILSRKKTAGKSSAEDLALSSLSAAAGTDAHNTTQSAR